MLPNPVGYNVSPECQWLERNKAEGTTQDVGFPMWGEQTFPLEEEWRRLVEEMLG